MPLIAHVDIDSFFAQVAQHDDPALRGLPVAVGGSSKRSVVATASYEARAYGVHSAMPMAQARALCKSLRVVEPTFPRYKELSTLVFEEFRRLTPQIQPVSIDEAYLDLAHTNTPPTSPADTEQMLASLRTRILERTGLVVSAGAGTTKIIAKLASTAAKPDGLMVLAPDAELLFLHTHPVTALQGVGPKTAKVLNDLGIATVAQLSAHDLAELHSVLTPARADALLALASNRDNSPVAPRESSKSMSTSQTYETDLVGHAQHLPRLRELVRKVHARLVRSQQAVSTVTVRWRTSDFADHSRSTTLPDPTDKLALLDSTATALLPSDLAAIRLLGVSLSGFSKVTQDTLDLVYPGADGLGVGLYVNHPTFGPGVITALDTETCTVRLDSGDEKVILREFFARLV